MTEFFCSHLRSDRWQADIVCIAYESHIVSIFYISFRIDSIWNERIPNTDKKYILFFFFCTCECFRAAVLYLVWLLYFFFSSGRIPWLREHSHTYADEPKLSPASLVGIWMAVWLCDWGTYKRIFIDHGSILFTPSHWSTNRENKNEQFNNHKMNWVNENEENSCRGKGKWCRCSLTSKSKCHTNLRLPQELAYLWNAFISIDVCGARNTRRIQRQTISILVYCIYTIQ